MSADKFLKQVENLNIVDEKLLAKIRKQVADPSKNVSAKSVAKLLIDKGQLTQAQVTRLLADDEEATLPPGTQHVDLVEYQPTEKEAHDTDQLISVDQPAAAVEPAPSDATRIDFPGENSLDEDIVEVDVEEVHEVAVDQIEMIENTIDPAAHQPLAAAPAPAMDPFGDPFADPMQAQEEAVEEKPVGFSGKRKAGDQWKSKWLFIAPAIIGVLFIVGVLLVFWFQKTPADELWNAAEQAHVRGDYGLAMEQYDQFINDYPNEDRVDLAKVYKTRSLLAQSYAAGQWDETYRRASTQLEPIEELEPFNEIRETLADILPNTAKGFATQAIKEKDIEKKREILGKVNEAMNLVNTPSYIPTKLRQRPITEKVIDEVEDMRREIQREITMEEEYVRVLADIKSLTTDGNTNGAIEAYQSLTSRYPRLKPRTDLQNAIAKASEAEQANVQSFTPDYQPATADRPSVIEKTIVLARQSGETAVGLENELIPFLVEGSVYMFKGGNGEIAWRRYVGHQTHLVPQWLDGARTKLLITRADFNELMVVEAADGKLVWRQTLPVGFHQPKVVAESILVTTIDGQMLRLNSADGTVASAARLPQRTSTNCDANSTFIYQPGMHTNLYVISASDMSCKNVTFVGPDHVPGSIVVPPHIVAGHLLLLVNGGDYTNLHIYRIEDNGQKLVEVQLIQRFTSGTVNTPFLRFDRWVVVASDTGDMKLLEINKTEEEEPVSIAAEFRFSVDESFSTRLTMSGMQHFIMAYSGRIWIANQGMMKFRVVKSQQKFERDLITNGKDTFLGPLVRKGDFALTLRRREGSSLASVAAIDPAAKEYKEIWRTDFSAPLAGDIIDEGSSQYVVSSQGDIFPLTQSLLDSGYSGQPTSISSRIINNLVFVDNIGLSPGKRVFYGPLGRAKILSVDQARTTSAARLVDMAAPADTPGCEPVAFGEMIIVASRKGQVAKVNPGSGQAIGTPFQPEVQPGKDIRWARPVITDDQRILIANGDAGIFYLLESTDKDIRKQHQLDHGNRLRSPLAKVGSQVLAVDFDGVKDRLVAFNVGSEVKISSTHELESDYVAGPFVFESGVLVQLSNNELAYFEAAQFADGTANSSPKWKMALTGEKMESGPVKIGDKILFAFANGNLAVVNPLTGERVKTIELGQPINGNPTVVNDKLMVGGRDGSVHVISMDQLK